jgi:hypothetical protein
MYASERRPPCGPVRVPPAVVRRPVLDPTSECKAGPRHPPH